VTYADGSIQNTIINGMADGDIVGRQLHHYTFGEDQLTPSPDREPI
jgi:hypothetical protein